jgi:hypothetical protein
MATLEEVTADDAMDQEILGLSTEDIVSRTRLLENEIKVILAFPRARLI